MECGTHRGQAQHGGGVGSGTSEPPEQQTSTVSGPQSREEALLVAWVFTFLGSLPRCPSGRWQITLRPATFALSGPQRRNIAQRLQPVLGKPVQLGRGVRHLRSNFLLPQHELEEDMANISKETRHICCSLSRILAWVVIFAERHILVLSMNGIGLYCTWWDLRTKCGRGWWLPRLDSADRWTLPTSWPECLDR